MLYSCKKDAAQKGAGTMDGIHEGHRARMKKKLLENGERSLADHELLEVLLYYAIPRRDTNELAHRLLSPKYHVDKRYLARVDGELSATDAEAFARGMTLGDGLECLPAGLELLPGHACIVTLREGKFHQVKRMLAARGAPVLYLKRLSMGPLVLEDSLAAGAYRLLRAEEILALYRVCGL